MNDGIDTLRSKQRTIMGYGWRPDLPDQRDYRVEDVLGGLVPVPAGLSKFSLRDKSPEKPWNQGQLGSCTGHGVGFLDMFERNKQGLPLFRPSRLALYYGGRLLESNTGTDGGAQIRDVMKTTAAIGAGPEDLWPYDIARFADAPPQAYLDAALRGQTTEYLSNPRDLDTIKRVIYNGYPIVMGFSVYESFESNSVSQGGHMPMPKNSEQLMGGHCVAWIGWDDSMAVPNTSAAGVLETRNSWSEQWGDAGHFWMPYDFAGDANLSDDFWSLRLIEAAS